MTPCVTQYIFLQRRNSETIPNYFELDSNKTRPSINKYSHYHRPIDTPFAPLNTPDPFLPPPPLRRHCSVLNSPDPRLRNALPCFTSHLESSLCNSGAHQGFQRHKCRNNRKGRS